MQLDAPRPERVSPALRESAEPQGPWPPDEFVARLRAVGESRYHDRHPFHVWMNAGRLDAHQLRGWAANRYYYQKCIPMKDAAILSNCPIREVRRAWIHRITDHDGAGEAAEPGGGIEKWLRLGEATGLIRAEILDERHVLPAVRFAVDAYVTLARTEPWPVAVASSLTEMFAPDLMARRIEAFERHYTWISSEGLGYFRTRVPRSRDDAKEALELALAHCNTRALQQRAVAALKTKCDILWSMLDAMQISLKSGNDE
jgi:pyrroloquinoline-quinone synthase